ASAELHDRVELLRRGRAGGRAYAAIVVGRTSTGGLVSRRMREAHGPDHARTGAREDRAGANVPRPASLDPRAARATSRGGQPFRTLAPRPALRPRLRAAVSRRLRDGIPPPLSAARKFAPPCPHAGEPRSVQD